MIDRVWKITLPLWLALGSALLLWSSTLSKPPPVGAAGPIDWPEIQLVPIQSGFDDPVHITHAGDGSNRLFVVEQDGVIRIIKNGTIVSTPFLDITDRVKFIGGNNEQGLLSVAFPPGYPDKNYFYVYYTSEESGTDGDNIVARFFVNDPVNNPDQADPTSKQQVLLLRHPGHENHNGGQ